MAHPPSFFPLVNWSLQGMEVGILATLTIGFSWPCRHWIEAGSRSSVWNPRGNHADPAGHGRAVCRRDHLLDGRGPGRADGGTHSCIGGAILAACLSLQTGLRISYFGDPLPNTYYLKLAGYPFSLRITRDHAVRGRQRADEKGQPDTRFEHAQRGGDRRGNPGPQEARAGGQLPLMGQPRTRRASAASTPRKTGRGCLMAARGLRVEGSLSFKRL
jgi:hypothetical protein